MVVYFAPWCSSWKNEGRYGEATRSIRIRVFQVIRSANMALAMEFFRANGFPFRSCSTLGADARDKTALLAIGSSPATRANGDRHGTSFSTLRPAQRWCVLTEKPGSSTAS